MSRPTLRDSLLLALALAPIALASPTWASDAPIAVAYELQGPPECGDHATLSGRVARRSARLVPADGEAAVQVAVQVRAGTPYTAAVTITQATGASERNLQGNDCEALMDAVALVIVVALDTKESTTVEPAPAGPLEGESGGPSQASPTATARATPSPSLPNQDTWRDEPDPPDLGGEPLDLAPDHWGIGVGARAQLGPAPDPLLGGELLLEATWGDGLVAPRLALAAGRMGAHSPERDGDAVFTLDQFAFELCPLRLGQSAWDLRPCLAGAGGRVQVRGENTLQPRSATRPWGTAGANVRAAVRPGARVELWTALGASMALVRDQYQFEPVVFHTVPREVFSLVLGASVLFP